MPSLPQQKPEVLPRAAKRARNDKDYAIEFGGYLATAAEAYMAAVNDSRPHPDEVTDTHRALKSAVYEFRKRAQRARR